jgi:hypothetical protein
LKIDWFNAASSKLWRIDQHIWHNANQKSCLHQRLWYVTNFFYICFFLITSFSVGAGQTPEKKVMQMQVNVAAYGNVPKQ